MWSRIQKSKFRDNAYLQLHTNYVNGCSYHNNQHLVDMYNYLLSTNEPYSKGLDLAVLCHDIVYDNEPDKEERSVQWMLDNVIYANDNEFSLEDIELASYNIQSTITHIVELPTDSPIIRADLHGFTQTDTVLTNYIKLKAEANNLYNHSELVFAEKQMAFLEGLANRVNKNILLDSEHSAFWEQVVRGIWLSIKISEGIINEN